MAVTSGRVGVIYGHGPIRFLWTAFKNETLETVARRLERFYQVKFVFQASSLRQREIILSSRNQSLEAIMEALSLTGDFRYRINGREVKMW